MDLRRRRELFFDERLFALRLAERLAFLLPPFFADAFLREERLFGAMTLNDLGLRVRGNSFELHHKGSHKNENDKFTKDQTQIEGPTPHRAAETRSCRTNSHLPDAINKTPHQGQQHVNLTQGDQRRGPTPTRNDDTKGHNQIDALPKRNTPCNTPAHELLPPNYSET